MYSEMIPTYVTEVLEHLEASGFEAYIVGGSCRDLIIGRTPQDYDVCTSALPDDIIAIFENTIPTGIAHGTITVKTAVLPIEVTTFRADGDYSDHRRPDAVKFSSSLVEDLARRDFTMNAIAMDRLGNLHDPFSGISDIKSERICCVGDTETRFREDALRMFRAFRFSAQLGFSLSDEIIVASRALAHTAKFVAAERIFSETSKMLLSSAPQSLGYAIDCGLYSEYVDCTKNVQLGHIAKFPLELNLRFCALCSVLKQEQMICDVAQFLRALRAPSAMIKTASKILEPLPIWSTQTNLARLASYVGRDDALCLAAAMGAEFVEPMVKLLRENRCLAISELDISGKELQELGFSGTQLGKMLKELLKHVVDNPDDNKNIILRKLAKGGLYNGDTQ